MKKNYTNEEVLSELMINNVNSQDIYNKYNDVIDNYKLISTHENKPVRILSSKYHILQHYDAFLDTTNSLDKIGIPYIINKFEKNWNIQGHHSIQVVFGFPDIKINVDGSDIMATLNLFNGCDGAIKFSRIFGAFRMLCSNGMMIGRELFTERKKHTINFEMQNLEKAIIKERNNFYKLGEFLQTIQFININENIKLALIKTGFPQKIINNMDTIYSKYDSLYKEETQYPDTLWAIYQVLTNWISNEVMKRSIYRGLLLHKQLNKTINKIIAERTKII